MNAVTKENTLGVSLNVYTHIYILTYIYIQIQRERGYSPIKKNEMLSQHLVE